jgi:hypothetical protein
MLERLNMYINKREMVVINAKLALKLEKNKEYANLMTHL